MVAGEARSDAPTRPSHALTFREARPDEWQAARRLRLEMLADTPHSFDDRLSDVREWGDDRWQTRHQSHLLPDSTVFVAVQADGRWVGHMAIREFHNYSPARVWLMGVYVNPIHRGDGTATMLLTMAEAWARERGFTELHLDVHEHAVPAQRFYQRHGFTLTGTTSPYPLDLTTSELEMVKLLVASPTEGSPGASPDGRGLPQLR